MTRPYFPPTWHGWTQAEPCPEISYWYEQRQRYACYTCGAPIGAGCVNKHGKRCSNHSARAEHNQPATEQHTDEREQLMDDITEMGEERLRTVCAWLKAHASDDYEGLDVIAATSDLQELASDTAVMALVFVAAYTDEPCAHIDRMFRAASMSGGRE